MNEIKRATTPTFRIRCKSRPVEDIAEIIFTIKQGKVSNTLFKDDFTLVSDEGVYWYQHKLTQQDTLDFNKYDDIHIQCDIVDTSGNRSRGLDRVYTVGDTLYERVVTP